MSDRVGSALGYILPWPEWHAFFRTFEARRRVEGHTRQDSSRIRTALFAICTKVITSLPLMSTCDEGRRKVPISLAPGPSIVRTERAFQKVANILTESPRRAVHSELSSTHRWCGPIAVLAIWRLYIKQLVLCVFCEEEHSMAPEPPSSSL